MLSGYQVCSWSVNVVIVKATNGPRYVVGCRRQLDKTKLKAGTRVALDMTTLTIMRLVSYYVCGWMLAWQGWQKGKKPEVSRWISEK